MKIIVDADACPSIKAITSLAINYNIELELYLDDTHKIENNYAKIITVSKGFQSVDMKIANILKNGDILITQDFGLATIALALGAIPISPKGLIFTNENIDQLNYEKHLNAMERKLKNRSKGIKKRTKEDEDKLIKSIEGVIM
ncbi:MAG: DUF188 domain-containing protein [Bacilli bacterium]